MLKEWYDITVLINFDNTLAEQILDDLLGLHPLLCLMLHDLEISLQFVHLLDLGFDFGKFVMMGISFLFVLSRDLLELLEGFLHLC